jgi:hypothetical protein
MTGVTAVNAIRHADPGSGIRDLSSAVFVSNYGRSTSLKNLGSVEESRVATGTLSNGQDGKVPKPAAPWPLLPLTLMSFQTYLPTPRAGIGSLKLEQWSRP